MLGQKWAAQLFIKNESKLLKLKEIRVLLRHQSRCLLARLLQLKLSPGFALMSYKMMSSTIVKKLKPINSSSLDSSTFQFQQRCSVSGTAKGKGKIKGAQPLKRSKVTTKKGSPSDPTKKEAGPRKQSQFDEMIDQCLTATSPLRFLKPKEKAREAEREKMGLISKANEQAKQNLKKMKKDEFASPWVMGTSGLDLITLGLVDEDKIPKYDLTVEDGRRLAKEYSRVLMRKHRARQAAESNLLRLKEAIEALPEGLRVEALVPDLSPFPVNRFMATLTPPIEGYIDKINEAARRSAAKGKLR